MPKKEKPKSKGYVLWNTKINGQASGPQAFTSEKEALDAKKYIVEIAINSAKREVAKLKETARRITLTNPRDERNFRARVGLVEKILIEKKELSQVLIVLPQEEANDARIRYSRE